MEPLPDQTRVTAVLGPTNTGKTFLAVERMLAHGSGIMGFPLRLLARENYDRVVAAKGADAVALITGEEKIIPARPRYYICTVESMPRDVAVDFLAVDEIQLCADPDRGHVFTDRLLRARGRHETMFLGSDAARPLIRALVPEAGFETRPRFSELSYAGPRKLNRLPSRTAVVAFSIADVYAIAETVRRHKGGAAVVMGALSPRTRNAQVSLYQSGDVDTLVATDAIGMGLNMDVDHVCFASLRKFDGHRQRPLTAAEIAQIAGRAGRHMADGTFGPTADLGPFDAEVIERVETHAFPPLRGGYWRNPDLTFGSLGGLIRTLDAAPPHPMLARAGHVDDRRVLAALAADEAVAAKADHRDSIRLLWEVCQVPDFRKVMPEAHAQLLRRVYLALVDRSGRLPTDWVADQVARLDRVDGDIDSLMGRIAGIRIWTYLSHRAGWIADGAHWQDRTRAIEDRLSDALHERLTAKFIDRRTAVLVRKLKKKGGMMAAVDKTGRVLLEGHPVGHMRGFRFVADDVENTTDATRAVENAAGAALKTEVAQRVKALEDGDGSDLSVADDGRIHWREAPIARVVAGADVLRPDAQVLPAEGLEGPERDRVQARLRDWLRGHVAAVLAPLIKLETAELSGAARGIAFQVIEGLGQIHRAVVDKQLIHLDDEERKSLSAAGVRFGVETVYIPDLLKPAQQRLKAVLWTARAGLDEQPAFPTPGRVTFVHDDAMPVAYLEVLGYRVIGGLVVRADMLERFASELRRLTKDGPTTMPPELLSILGISAEQAKPLLAGLSFDLEITEDQGLKLKRRRKPKAKARHGGPKGKAAGPRPKGGAPRKDRPAAKDAKPKDKPIDPDSPFAKLAQLKLK